MNIAILGVGSIIPAFLEASALIPELKMYAIFGRKHNLEKMQKMQEEHGIECIYHDYDELLADKKVDTVYVALPNHLHYAFAKKALEYKKHVIIEKPFGSTYEQAKELIGLAKEKGVFIFEAISNQYMPNFTKTKELVKEVGNVRIVQMNYSQYSSRYDAFKQGIIHPVFDCTKSGGALMDLNVYNVHYILGLFGKPERIHYIANVIKGVDTSGILTLEYKDFQCVAIAAKDCKAPVCINVQGDEGYIHSDAPSNVYDSFEFSKNSGTPQKYNLNEGKPRLYYELLTFVNMVKNNDQEFYEKISKHSEEVMTILDEARRQAGIPL